MEGAVVSVSKGVMDSVLAKLTDLVGDTGASLIGVCDDIKFLREELPAMNALLENLKDTDELNPQVKNWRDEVREMTYDIEDCIDDFRSNVASVDTKVSFLEKAYHFLKTLRAHVDAARQIKELKTRLQEIDERRKRYKVDDCCTSSTSIEALDARLPALYNEAASLVGIDNPKKELIGWVLDDEHQNLKVVSIVGPGGLGKTTLANEVYREVKGQFSCKAFVPVSSTPDMTRILTSMLSQLKPKDSIINTACDVQSLVDNLRKCLHDKRYLVIIDDLWEVPHWKTIQCAFPQNNQQSRVIVTTRRVDVARACCSDNQYIHDMQPLSDTNSRKLFFKRLSISEDASHFRSSEAVLCKILKKCGGLPLAIMTIAGILACQPLEGLKEQWECIQNSLAVQSAADPSLRDMTDILDLSYKSLPHHLKSCFLYLGKYPEDHTISRDDLVRQWVAEGFVMRSPGRDVWDIAEGYFNGLVNRSMIQPVYNPFDSTKVVECTVHDMILDLIIKRCREDNFMAVARDPRTLRDTRNVRRLSVNMSGMSGAEHVTMTQATTSLLSQVRSLAMFGGPYWMPLLLELKFLRVLFLDFDKPVERIDLTCIIQLSQLRYLRAKRWQHESNIELPSQIQRLQHLETLEFTGLFRDCYLPSDIVDLSCLSHLQVPWKNTRLPDGIGKLSLLRTLGGFSLWKSSSENIKALGVLTNLVDLVLSTTLERGNSESMLTKTYALSSALEKLSYLKHIWIFGSTECRGDALSSLSPPFHNLETFRMSGLTFSRVPRWMGGLPDLRMLEIQVDENSGWEDVGIIGTLPSLVSLNLQIPGVPAERIVITGFHALKRFRFDCDGMSRLSFEAGAMPNLCVLELIYDPGKWDKAAPAGLKHLSSLTQIRALKAAPVPSPEEIREQAAMDLLIRGVFQEATDSLPTRPAFTIGSSSRTHYTIIRD